MPRRGHREEEQQRPVHGRALLPDRCFRPPLELLLFRSRSPRRPCAAPSLARRRRLCLRLCRSHNQRRPVRRKGAFVPEEGMHETAVGGEEEERGQGRKERRGRGRGRRGRGRRGREERRREATLHRWSRRRSHRSSSSSSSSSGGGHPEVHRPLEDRRLEQGVDDRKGSYRPPVAPPRPCRRCPLGDGAEVKRLRRER